MSVVSEKRPEQNSSVKNASYLLILDGSAEAMAAAKFAWDLAKASEAKVTAQHVLDTPAVWGSLSFSLPGFVGSGVYIEAHKKIMEALRSVAETVMLAYNSQAEGQQIDVDNYIDEGDKVTEICRRAKDHDLIILGQMSDADDCKQDNSLGLRVSNQSQKPVVIVESKPLPRSGVLIVIANKELNPEVLSPVYEFARKNGITVT